MEESDQDHAASVDRARDHYQKLCFYRVSLVFAVLAISIQTANFGTFVFADISELLGWLALLISGTVGLSRIEIGVDFDRLVAIVKVHGRRKDRNDATEHFDKGERWYAFHKYSLVAGFVCLLVARSCGPVISIYERMTSTGC
ncbi:MAG: hypothetical protein IID44_09890 [Planctomycetes bacterium]|nr:hypothetical protein [Planctomycetota bacterium]